MQSSIVRQLASSGAVLVRPRRHRFRPRRRPRHTASAEGGVFLVAVVAIQTTLTPPKYADAVALLLASIGPVWSLPGRLCIVGAVAVQWRVVLRSNTKDDRVGLVARHMHRAFRRRTQTLAELHDVQHVSATHYFQSVSDTGDPTLPEGANICLRLPTCAQSCASFDITVE